MLSKENGKLRNLTFERRKVKVGYNPETNCEEGSIEKSGKQKEIRNAANPNHIYGRCIKEKWMAKWDI